MNITIILPVRDEAKSIKRSIDLLLTQAESPSKVIFIDGGSTDITREIIKKALIGINNFYLIEHNDAYPGRARNIGISIANSDWVALTDAGLIIPENWLFNLNKVLVKNDQFDLVLGSYEPLMKSYFHECLALAFIDPGKKVDDRIVRAPSTASMMMRKEVWKSVGGFREDLRAAEDLDFFDKLAAGEFKTAYAPDAVVYWQIPDNFQGVHRKFRTYSYNMLKAGFAERWHKAIVRMYLIGLILVVMAIFSHWAWCLLLLAGFAWRIHRSIRLRRPSLNLINKIGIRTYILVGIILLTIDIACFYGTFDFILSRETRPVR